MSSRLERTQHHLHRTNRYADFRPETSLHSRSAAGLMLYSGNDCATAIAEHIFPEFRGEICGADESGKHGIWVLSIPTLLILHGLHSEDHYTTAYDLYLIFNACAKDERFIDLISQKEYTVHITGADKTVRIRRLGSQRTTIRRKKKSSLMPAGDCIRRENRNNQ